LFSLIKIGSAYIETLTIRIKKDPVIAITT